MVCHRGDLSLADSGRHRCPPRGYHVRRERVDRGNHSPRVCGVACLPPLLESVIPNHHIYIGIEQKKKRWIQCQISEHSRSIPYSMRNSRSSSRTFIKKREKEQ